MFSRLKRPILCLILIVSILSACRCSPREMTKAVAISTSPKPSATLFKLPTKTNSASLTPSVTLSPSPSATKMPTWTPLQTLEPTAALTYVIDLLQNNAGCKLPCWWGITPGKTTWDEAHHFLDSFSYSYGILGDPIEYQVAEFGTPLTKSIGADPYRFGIKNGIIEDIYHIYFGNLTTSYNLVELLTAYGQPDGILVSAYYEPGYSDYMTEVAVFYLRQGILVKYFDSDGGTNGDGITKCPQKATYPWLDLWSPSLELTLDEAASRYLDMRNWPPYRPLQVATGMSVDNFYQTFKDPNNNKCLELSASDWPKY
jgi:hypothetical protein